MNIKLIMYSENAKKECGSVIPVYKNENVNNKLRLLTTHPKRSLLSQGFKNIDTIATADLSKEVAQKYNILQDEIITLKSKNGKIDVKANITDKVLKNVIHMNVGWWAKSSNPNFLTENAVSDMGKQIAYNDTFVEIETNLR